MRQKGLNGFGSNISSAASGSTATDSCKQNYINYTVEKRDTLSAIAAKYDTTVSKLAEINGIKDVNKIYVGQLLRVPGGLNNGGTSIFYTVKPGDTLSDIAIMYSTTVDKLVIDNGIKDKNKIFVGQTIKIK